MAYYLLLLFFLLEYARPAAFFPQLMALHLNSIIPVMAALAALRSKGRTSNAALFANPHVLLMIAFLGLIAISVLTAEVTERAWDKFVTVFGFTVVCITIARTATDLRQVKGLFWILVAVHIIVVLENPDLMNGADRPSLSGAPFLGDGNDFALSMNIVIPMALFLLFHAKGVLTRLMYIVALLTFVFAIVATQSRGGSIGLIAVALFYWARTDRKLPGAAIVVGAFVLVMALAPPQYFDRMRDATNTQEGSAQGRIAAWKGSWQMALSRPILGVGAGSFGPMYGAILKVPTQTAHSIYFLVLGELGFPGLIVLLSIVIGNLVANLRLGWQLRQRPPEQVRVHDQLLAATSGSLVAYAVAGAFLSAAYYPHMYVLVGLMVASRRLAREGLRAEASTVTVESQRAVSYHWALRKTMAPAASRFVR